ncbi:hypothetical protein LTR04_001643, partial [Oleoguttula sp. CCFEE 6159]
RVPIIRYDLYVKGEKPYAVFIFYYRSEEKLRKFCFDGFPQRVKAAESNKGLQAVHRFRNARELNKQLSALTPLSISFPLTSAICKVSLGKRGRDDEEEEEANADQSDIQAPRSAKSSRVRSPSSLEDSSSDRNTALVDFISLLRGERELPDIFVTPPDGGATAPDTIANTEDSDHMKTDEITEGGAAHSTEDHVVCGPAVVTKADDMDGLSAVFTNKHAVIDTPATSTNMDDMEGLSAFDSPPTAVVGTPATEAHMETTGGPKQDHAQAMLSADMQNIRTDAAEVSGAAETEMERV